MIVKDSKDKGIKTLYPIELGDRLWPLAAVVLIFVGIIWGNEFVRSKERHCVDVGQCTYVEDEDGDLVVHAKQRTAPAVLAHKEPKP